MCREDGVLLLASRRRSQCSGGAGPVQPLPALPSRSTLHSDSQGPGWLAVLALSSGQEGERQGRERGWKQILGSGLA